MKPHRHQNTSARLLLAAALCISACSTKVQVTVYPTQLETTLATFSSYCWAEDDPREAALAKIEPAGGHYNLFDSSIREVIDADLGRKHYQKTACASADFIIDYRMGLHEDVAVVDETVTDDTHTANPYGVQWRIDDDRSMTYKGLAKPNENVITVRRGTIHIAAFSNSNKLLWHSSGEKILNDQATEEERRASLKKGIAEIMEEFPAKK
jgi:hypothetical protein